MHDIMNKLQTSIDCLHASRHAEVGATLTKETHQLLLFVI